MAPWRHERHIQHSRSHRYSEAPQNTAARPALLRAVTYRFEGVVKTPDALRNGAAADADAASI